MMAEDLGVADSLIRPPRRPPPYKVPKGEVLSSSPVPQERDTPIALRSAPQEAILSVPLIGLDTEQGCEEGEETCPIPHRSKPTEPSTKTVNGPETTTSSNVDAAILITGMTSMVMSDCTPEGSHEQSPSLLLDTPTTASLEIRRPPRPPNRPPPPRSLCEPPMINLKDAPADLLREIDPPVTTPTPPPVTTPTPPDLVVTALHEAPPSSRTQSINRPPRPPRPISGPLRPYGEVSCHERSTTATDALVGVTMESNESRQGNRFLRNMRKTFNSLQARMTLRRGSSPYVSQRDSSVGRSRSAATLPHIRHTREEGNRDTTVVYPDPLPIGVIDPLVIQCVSYLNREHILEEEGLFRVPGDVAAIRKLRGQFVMGDIVDLNTILDPHTVAGLMKAHFREQKTSIIPRGAPLAAIVNAVEQRNPTAMNQVLYGIGTNQMATLRMVAELMKAVVDHSGKNRMTTGTLGTSMGPSLFPYLPPSTASLVLTFMVDHVMEIFNT